MPNSQQLTQATDIQEEIGISINLPYAEGTSEKLHILTNTYTTALTTKQVTRKVLFPPHLIKHILLSQIKITYTKKTLE